MELSELSFEDGLTMVAQRYVKTAFSLQDLSKGVSDAATAGGKYLGDLGGHIGKAIGYDKWTPEQQGSAMRALQYGGAGALAGGGLGLLSSAVQPKSRRRPISSALAGALLGGLAGGGGSVAYDAMQQTPALAENKAPKGSHHPLTQAEADNLDTPPPGPTKYRRADLDETPSFASEYMRQLTPANRDLVHNLANGNYSQAASDALLGQPGEGYSGAIPLAAGVAGAGGSLVNDSLVNPKSRWRAPSDADIIDQVTHGKPSGLSTGVVSDLKADSQAVSDAGKTIGGKAGDLLNRPDAQADIISGRKSPLPKILRGQNGHEALHDYATAPAVKAMQNQLQKQQATLKTVSAIADQPLHPQHAEAKRLLPQLQSGLAKLESQLKQRTGLPAQLGQNAARNRAHLDAARRIMGPNKSMLGNTARALGAGAAAAGGARLLQNTFWSGPNDAALYNARGS